MTRIVWQFPKLLTEPVQAGTSFSRSYWARGAEAELRSTAACTAVRTELRANGGTTPCRGCGPKSFLVLRVIAGETVASKRGFPERAWKRITIARREFPSKVPRSSHGAAMVKRPRWPLWIDSKAAWRGHWHN